MNSPIRSYKDLRTWQNAQELCVLVYKATETFPVNEQFGLTSQLRRSAVSIPSNIAEGFGRQTAREKQQFYHHALGSLFELETQVDIASRLRYLNVAELEGKIEQVKSMLLALLKANKNNFVNRKSLIINPEAKL